MNPDYDLPPGYTVKQQYSRKWWPLHLITVYLLLCSTFVIAPEVFRAVTAYFSKKMPLLAVLWLIVTYIPGFLIASGITALFHEWTHFIILESFGYESELRWGIFGLPPVLENPQVRPSNEFLKRDHLLAALIAPLLVVGFLAAVLVFLQFHPWMVFAGKAIFIINTSVSSADLYDSFQYLKLPENTLLHYTLEEAEPMPYILERDN